MRSWLGALLILSSMSAVGYAVEPRPAPPAAKPPAPTTVKPAARIPLDGPYPDLASVWRLCHYGWDKDESKTTTLAEHRAANGMRVSLRQYQSSPSGASCAVTIESAAGLYVGPSFLCYADRSDERVSTRQVTIATTASEATLRFGVSYTRVDYRDPAPRLNPAIAYVIRCSLGGGTPHCEPPPGIGGYGSDGCKKP